MLDPPALARLRERYGGANGGTIHDPAFHAVAASQFREGDRRTPPYADPATLLGAPWRHEPAGLDVALVGVPMDLGVTNRSGARLGPRAVRAVERIGPYEHVMRIAPATRLSYADLGDIPFRSRFDLASCHADIETFMAGLRAAGVVPLAVGGDHSLTYPILRALGHERPLGLVHIDAHCDTSGTYEGCRFHHGGPFRQAVLDGVLDPTRTIQIGIRGGAEYLWEFSADSGMTVIHAEEIDTLGVPAIAARARAVAGDGPAYVSFDVDSLDPAFAPGTGTPEAGGLTPREALALLRGLSGLDIVGADVVEVAPQYDATTSTAQIAAQVLFTELCLVAAIRPPRSPAGSSGRP
ncbi:MAG: agmatinase [Acetobacteraceae bacterium]